MENNNRHTYNMNNVEGESHCNILQA